jgi:hypothetical protein
MLDKFDWSVIDEAGEGQTHYAEGGFSRGG